MSDASPPLHIHFRFMAPKLMDIRTRLPAEALARDPELSISEGVNLSLGSLPPAAPKLIVTQRAGPRDETAWLESTARMIKAGWISVLEFDDHPHFAAAIAKEALTETAWRHFSHFHAMQVSTLRLAEVFAPWNPHVAVFPNAVFDLPPFLRRTGPPKVFYGAVTRGQIAVDVVRSLSEVSQRYKDLEFVVVGDKAVLTPFQVRIRPIMAICRSSNTMI